MIDVVARSDHRERRSNLLVIRRLLRKERSQRHLKEEIASGKEQERPRNDIVNGDWSY